MKIEIPPDRQNMAVAIDDNADRRALVIDEDAGVRRDICEVLAGKGYEVSACESVEEGTTFFRDQPLVIAGAAGEVAEFVASIRGTEGVATPYIITLQAAGRAEAEGLARGVNAGLSLPVDGVDLGAKIDAAQAWLSQQPDKVTGNWDEAALGDAEPSEDAEPLFDAETTDLALGLLDGGDDGGQSGDVGGSVREGAENTVQVWRGSGKAAELEGSGGASRQHLHLMAEACPLSMAIFDLDMHYLFANSAWRRAFGLAESALAGQSHFELFSDVSDKWRLLCERCLAEGDEQSGEELVEWADGACDWVRWAMRPWYSQDGMVGGLVASAQSITGEKRILREQRFESDLAEAVMASPSNPVLVLDVNGRIVRSNRAAKQFGRWDPVGEGDKYYWEAFLSKEARREAQGRFLDFARRLLDGGEFSFPDAEVEEVLGHDGKPRRVVWTNSPRRGEEGEVTGVVRVGFDLDRFEDRSKEEGLRETVLHGLPVPGWRCDAAGEIDLVNAAWQTLRGRTLEEELGNGWMVGLDAADIDPLSGFLRAAAVEGKAFSKVVRLAGGDGQTRHLRFSAEPGEGDGAAPVYGVAIDVSAAYELNVARGEVGRRAAEMEAAMAKAEAARAETEAATAETETATAKTEAATVEIEAATARAARFEADLATAGVDLQRLRADVAKAGGELDRLRSIPESAPFGIVLLGRDGKTVYCNPAHAEVAGSDIGGMASIEDWLRAHCVGEGDGAAEELVEAWRAKIWRKGVTGVYPIRTDEGAVRELEFRPKLMADGGLLVTIFDVTDTRRGEEALRASEAKFRALFRDSGVGMAMVDSGGGIFDSNPALEALLGAAGADVRQRGIEDLFSPEGARQLSALLGGLGAGGRHSGDAVVDLATVDGEPITVHLHVAQVNGADGRVMFTTYFFHDISDRLRAERGLEDLQAETRALFGASPDMIVVLDDSKRIVELIPPVDFPLQVDREASLGRELGEVFPDIGVSPQQLAEALSGEGVFQHGFRVAGEGGTVHLELRAARSGSSNTVILMRDVSRAHEAQTKLKWQALTFAHIGDAIMVADMRGRVIDWNPAAEKLFGYTKSEAVGLGLHEIYGGDDPAAFRNEFTEAIRSAQCWESRATFVHRDGAAGQCDVVFVTLRDEDDTPLALVGVNREARPEAEAEVAPPLPRQGDATDKEMVAQATATATATARAEIHGRLRANLKTISTLLGLQARGEGVGAETARAGKGRVDALAMLQSHMIGDGQFARIDFGAYLKELIGELLEREAPEEADVTVRLHAKGVILPAGLAMPVALIANELLCNAFRHGCADCAEVAVECTIELDAQTGRGWLMVQDDAGALPLGFTLGSAPGLGLKIVRGLAERIGGEVEVEDGIESEFRVGFRLPTRA